MNADRDVLLTIYPLNTVTLRCTFRDFEDQREALILE